MKKLKKLLSVVLAGAMALSLCATALADDDDNEPAANNPDAVYEFGDDASGNIDATSTSQGKLPAKPVSIILPTVSNRVAGTAQLFDFYLDPHNLIAKTDGAEFAEEGETTPKFAPNTKLYFASPAGSEYDFSGTSKSLTVTNTGFVDVDVDLDLAFDRDGADFDLVATADDLSATAGARPQMYLAVVGSNNETTAVLDPTGDPTVEAAGDDDYINEEGAPVFAYADFEEDPDDADAPTQEDYDAAKAAFDEFLADATITLTYTAAVEDDESTTEEDESADAQLLVAVGGEGVDDYIVTISSVGTDGATAVPDGIFNGDADVLVAFATETIDLGEVTFSIAFPDDEAEGGEQTLTFDVPHTGAQIGVALGVLADSYKLAQTDDADTIAALEAKNIEVTTQGYYYEQQEKDTSKYPAYTFHLVGNINEALEEADGAASPWDDITANIGFEMTWDVTAYNKTNARTKLYDAANGGGGGGAVESKEPEVKVTTQASGTTTATKTATLTWTDGTGDYAGYAPTSAKNGAGTTIALSNSDHTISLTATSSNKTNKNCVITFTKEGADAIEVEVTGWFK